MIFDGVITLLLKNGIRVDMTASRSVRIVNLTHAMSLSSDGACSAVLHPSGHVFQYGSRVDIVAFDKYGNDKYAKMSYKGVSFTSNRSPLVVVMDSRKISTTVTMGTFMDMTKDISLPVFFRNARRLTLPDAIAIQRSSRYWVNRRGTENWKINDVWVSQTRNGLVRVSRKGSRYQMVMSSFTGRIALSTPFVHCTASHGKTSHLFVRRGERRMYYDGSDFILRNGRRSSGLNKYNQITLF